MKERLILHFKSLFRKDPGFRESEDLPNITDDSDDSDTGSSNPPLAPIRSFRGIFQPVYLQEMTRSLMNYLQGWKRQHPQHYQSQLKRKQDLR